MVLEMDKDSRAATTTKVIMDIRKVDTKSVATTTARAKASLSTRANIAAFLWPRTPDGRVFRL